MSIIKNNLQIIEKELFNLLQNTTDQATLDSLNKIKSSLDYINFIILVNKTQKEHLKTLHIKTGGNDVL